MTGNQILSAFIEIAQNDLFPVLAITGSGVDSMMALHYLNVGAKRVMRGLRRQAKATFSTTEGTSEYNIQSVTAKRFFEITKVFVDGSILARTAIDDDSGYTVIGDTLTIHTVLPADLPVTLIGYHYSQDISATDAEVTDIPGDLHLAVAQFAVVESCGSHDVDPVQQQKLMNMMRLAEGAVQRQRQCEAMSSFPEDLVNGRT